MLKNNLSIGARMAITAILAATVLLAAAFAVSAVATLQGTQARADSELRSGVARVADAISSAQRSLQRLADNQHRLFVGLMPGSDWSLAAACHSARRPTTAPPRRWTALPRSPAASPRCSPRPAMTSCA